MFIWISMALKDNLQINFLSFPSKCYVFNLVENKKVYFYKTKRIKLLTEHAIYVFLLKEIFKVRASYDFFF